MKYPIRTNVMVVAVAFAAATVGCRQQKEEPATCHVKGVVTFAGKPITDGLITFEPDVSKGNQGRAGSAVIKNGHYDTRKTGRGVHAGAVTVWIGGFDGANVEKSDSGHGAPLFPLYSVKRDVSVEAESFDVDVPNKKR